jgi:hypothetical protein
MHLVDDGLAQLRDQGAGLGGQVEPQDVETGEVLGETT